MDLGAGLLHRVDQHPGGLRVRCLLALVPSSLLVLEQRSRLLSPLLRRARIDLASVLLQDCGHLVHDHTQRVRSKSEARCHAFDAKHLAQDLAHEHLLARLQDGFQRRQLLLSASACSSRSSKPLAKR